MLAEAVSSKWTKLRIAVFTLVRFNRAVPRPLNPHLSLRMRTPIAKNVSRKKQAEFVKDTDGYGRLFEQHRKPTPVEDLSVRQGVCKGIGPIIAAFALAIQVACGCAVEAQTFNSTSSAAPQDIRDEGHAVTISPLQTATGPRSSPFTPPEENDRTFVVDGGSGLDTGCTFRNSGPLIITIKVDRVVGDVAKLKANKLISQTARLVMPAFDVDFFGGGAQFNPERDRVSFNGHVVPREFLRGDNNIWILNEFEVPIEWVNFPPDPKAGNQAETADNIVRIDIDTANTEERWCTAIDWVVLSFDAVGPVVMVHGIFSSGDNWDELPFRWVTKLNELGVPNSNALNMGWVDSIRRNSLKIADEVTISRRRWGVDKVTIVAHSKGGLDSREFVEGDDSVHQLIQLGTPNAGSALADLFQGVAVRPGGPAAELLSAWAAPAFLQLTTSYMIRRYNPAHGFNGAVDYSSLAGDYTNPISTIDRLLLLITGRGDTVVPISSAHSLSYMRHLLFASAGSDTQAKHMLLNNSQGVFNAVEADVTEVLPAAARGAAATMPEVARTSALLGTMQQGQLQRQTILIDQSVPLFFSLFHLSGNLDMALISPSGRRFDQTSIQGNAGVSREEGEIPGGLAEVYSFSIPEVGAWTVEVSAPLVVPPGGTASYAVYGWLEGPAITFEGDVVKANISQRERLQLLGTLRNNGAPLTGAAVTAKIRLPNDDAADLVLHDDGRNGDAIANDGVYTGDFTATSQPGNYRIAFLSTRPPSGAGPAFSREDFALATVSRSSSTISGPFEDVGVDTDGDGLFNLLRINVGLNITTAGNYRLVGILTDAGGNTQNFSAKVAVNAGLNTVALDFDGEIIFKNRIDGPYHLSSIRLAEDNDLEIAILDERTDVFDTAAYSFRSFQHPPIVLTGVISSKGVDTNGNGLFDLLQVGLEAEITHAGFYQWSARLLDRNGVEIGFAANSGNLVTGTNVLDLFFDGTEIGRGGVDGPYFVRGLLVFGAGDSLVATGDLATAAFSASQFEGFDKIPPVISSITAIPDVLWPPNRTLRPVSLTVNATDNSGQVSCKISSVRCNEPVKAGDIVITGDLSLTLRAERLGGGDGRIYTIIVRCTDAVGNHSDATVAIAVPHDQRGKPTPTPTPTPSSTPITTPTPTVTPTPRVSPTATPSPSATAPPSQPLNISTRGRVESGDNAMIGGLIITGNISKRVIIRAIAPSLQAQMPSVLRDPVLELHGPDGLFIQNDDWQDDFEQSFEIGSSTIAPTNNRESAIIATLAPGNYTAAVSGKNGESGLAIVEVYDLDFAADSRLANISTRGVVRSGDDVLIGGFILGGSARNAKVLVRAIGPSLAKAGMSNSLSDPTLELRDGNGVLLRRNDNWKEQQRADIEGTTIAPTMDSEAAILADLTPGPYTTIVAGNGTSGVGLIEIYNLR